MKKMLVVGATSGIAKELVYLLAKHRTDLILAGRDLNGLSAMSKDLQVRYGIQAHVEYFEALEYATHPSFWRKCVEKLGPLDGCFVAHGYLGDQKLAKHDFLEAEKIIHINFTSCVSLLNLAADYFEQQQRGIICVLSSVAGDRGRQSNYLYGSAKAALSTYLQGLRNRLSRSGVQVTTIKPGYVDTRMTYGRVANSPLLAKPDRVAADIFRVMRKKKDVAYVPWFWFYIMWVVKRIPESIFKRLKL